MNQIDQMERLKHQLATERVQHGITRAMWALANQKAIKTMSGMVAINDTITKAGLAYQSLAQAVDDGRAIIVLDRVVIPKPGCQNLDEAVSLLSHH